MVLFKNGLKLPLTTDTPKEQLAEVIQMIYGSTAEWHCSFDNEPNFDFDVFEDGGSFQCMVNLRLPFVGETWPTSEASQESAAEQAVAGFQAFVEWCARAALQKRPMVSGGRPASSDAAPAATQHSQALGKTHEGQFWDELREIQSQDPWDEHDDQSWTHEETTERLETDSSEQYWSPSVKQESLETAMGKAFVAKAAERAAEKARIQVKDEAAKASSSLQSAAKTPAPPRTPPPGSVLKHAKPEQNSGILQPSAKASGIVLNSVKTEQSKHIFAESRHRYHSKAVAAAEGPAVPFVASRLCESAKQNTESAHGPAHSGEHAGFLEPGALGPASKKAKIELAAAAKAATIREVQAKAAARFEDRRRQPGPNGEHSSTGEWVWESKGHNKAGRWQWFPHEKIFKPKWSGNMRSDRSRWAQGATLGIFDPGMNYKSKLGELVKDIAAKKEKLDPETENCLVAYETQDCGNSSDSPEFLTSVRIHRLTGDETFDPGDTSSTKKVAEQRAAYVAYAAMLDTFGLVPGGLDKETYFRICEHINRYGTVLMTKLGSSFKVKHSQLVAAGFQVGDPDKQGRIQVNLPLAVPME